MGNNLARNNIYDGTMNGEELVNVIQNLQKAIEKGLSGTDIKPHFGNGTPKDSLGENKDVYLDVEQGELYRKEKGSWNRVMDSSNTKGDDGDSAYDIAVANGFKGTEKEWLESLKGEQGNKGDSAYDVAVSNGFEGAENEWVNSLKGDQGDKGKSAYDIAVEQGFSGNKDKWLESLKGDDGAPSQKEWNDLVQKVDDLQSKVNDSGGGSK